MYVYIYAISIKVFALTNSTTVIFISNPIAPRVARLPMSKMVHAAWCNTKTLITKIIFWTARGSSVIEKVRAAPGSIVT